MDSNNSNKRKINDTIAVNNNKKYVQTIFTTSTTNTISKTYTTPKKARTNFAIECKDTLSNLFYHWYLMKLHTFYEAIPNTK